VRITLRRVERPMASAPYERWGNAPDIMAEIRKDWEDRFGGGDRRWDDVAPHYTHALEMGRNPTYAGKSWSEIEPEARRRWTERHPDTPWEKVSESVKSAWHHLSGR
jgi:hypothetical protein